MAPTEGMSSIVKSVIRPVETSQYRYFFERFALMKDILYGKNSVFGKVTDHWYRIEFQNRGAPHVHMLLWVALEFRENKVVVATLPRGTQNNEGRLLKELVTSFQIHSCVERRCKRGPKGESLEQCKYGFPYKMRPTDGLDRLGIRYEYARTEEEDERIVPYVPDLLLAWRGHLNVQKVTRTHLPS